MKVTGFAPAKVNLYLHVGAARADGMHPLDSLVMFAADVGDVVAASVSDSLTLSVTGPFAASLEGEGDNLVLRAARALADAAGVPARAAIALDKRVPVASGIGGGSADAAAALRVLNRLWRIGAPGDELARIAKVLGADTPCCVRAQTARMRGVGEALADSAAPPLHAVLVNPLAPAPTGAVYRAFDDLGLGADLDDPGDAPTKDMHGWLLRRRNDLSAPAERVAPVISGVLAALRRAAPDAIVRMSGSGATCFALTDAAAEVAAIISAAKPEWWVRATRLGGVDVAPVEG